MKRIVRFMIHFGMCGIAGGQAQDATAPAVSTHKVSDALERLELRQVKIGGEIGRRIDLTIKGNLLKIDLDKDFLAPLTGGNYTGLNDGSGSFLGVGKTLDGMVRLAAYSGDMALIARKNHMVDSIISSQGSDGYIGMMAPERRTWGLWDLHEEAFIITALVSDYRLFGRQRSLTAARRLCDYLIERWPSKPQDWEKSIKIREFMAEVGLSYGFLYLSETIGDQRYLDFALK